MSAHSQTATNNDDVNNDDYAVKVKPVQFLLLKW